MSAIANGNRSPFNSSRYREAHDRPARCCARCKTPGYGCANTDCRCHPHQERPQ